MTKKKQTVVLDLDSTLIYTFNGKFEILDDLIKKSNAHLESRVYLIDFIAGSKKNQMWGVVRPFTDHFIEYCFERFEKVIVWSAGTYEYVHHICEVLFQKQKPHEILTFDDCEKDSDGKFRCKPLETLYKKYDCLNPKNTLIIDDNPQAFSCNLENAVQIAQYSASFGETKSTEEIIGHLVDDSDTQLSSLIKWLDHDHVRDSPDVRKLEKPRLV